MIQKEISLYLDTVGIPERVPVSQFDTMWQFVFKFYKDGQQWEIPSGATAVLNGRKSDNNVFAFSGVVANNTVTIDCNVQMTACAGRVECELSIVSDGKTVGSRNFWLMVEAAPKSAGDVASDTVLDGYGIMVTNAVDAWLNAHSSQIGGLTNEAKQALLTLLAHAYFDNNQGKVYRDALEAALYPPANLVSISAVSNQGSAVIYDTDSLDTLKQYLTVTANYDDSSAEEIEAYTLSGTLTEGTSTITVAYGGKTATFDVVVAKYMIRLTDGTYKYQWDNTQITVENNKITWGDYVAANRGLEIPFTESVSLAAGDTVTFNTTNDNPDSSITVAAPIKIAGLSYQFLYSYSNASQSKTFTISEDTMATSIVVGSGGGEQQMGASFVFSMSVNGEVII